MPKAAKDLEKAVGKEERRGREEALAARGKAAEDSFRKAEPDPQLVQSSRGSIDADRIQCFETVHLRVTTTPALLPPEDLEAALRFGEQAIELFRKELLDPYEAEDFPDRILDKVFAEWILVPFRDEMFRGVSEQYMGSNWSRDVEARQRIGERRDGTQEKPFRFLRKSGVRTTASSRWSPTRRVMPSRACTTATSRGVWGRTGSPRPSPGGCRSSSWVER